MDKKSIKKIVESAVDKVFLGNSRINDGSIENNSTQDTKEYFLGLAKGDKIAKEEQNVLLKKIENYDFDTIVGEIVK
ncbi:hypothetical protein CQA49_08960 [Helicobacter sp. MIT 00-7814]|uniref:hypothetical protein n=1 Tax=unclassified Helicobacter TaxID=2593540 RepID=UPI000E1E5F16|nr:MULTISPECIES: hypothetical protein [unclassified Helicobacter]RDU51958.1 hypothetical protein CQA49_08960 [Helicobacter sp. MIT 00-7814]RDU54128.1 hypothetical protein CQA37_05815 [Helicobacter sp. MIT 99-10781]